MERLDDVSSRFRTAYGNAVINNKSGGRRNIRSESLCRRRFEYHTDDLAVPSVHISAGRCLDKGWDLESGIRHSDINDVDAFDLPDLPRKKIVPITPRHHLRSGSQGSSLLQIGLTVTTPVRD